MQAPQIRVGVIGCGYWGPKVIRNFHELPETSVEMVSDLDTNRLDQIQRTFPSIRVTTDYHDILRSPDVDAVVVATPVSTHFTIARDALLSGKHVLVEKPLTNRAEDAEELVALARSRDLRLMVGHVFEYSPAVRMLRDIVQQGELGEIYYFDLVRATLGLFQRDINVIWDLAPHDFSILRYVLGEEPIGVSATGEAYVQPGIHDVAYIKAQFSNSVQAHIRVSWLEPRKQRRITVVGSKKMLVYDDVEAVEKIRLFDMGVEWPDPDRLGSGQLRYRYGDIVSPRISPVEPLQEECRHFADCIREGRDPQSDGVSGLRVVELLEAADRSLRAGGTAHDVQRVPSLVWLEQTRTA
jgi:predicted dehydrogenase